MTIIRKIRESDAEGFLNMCKQIDRETQFMLLEPGERTTTVEQQRTIISNFLASPNSLLLVVEDRGRIVGYLRARGGDYKRSKHSVHIDVGITEAYTGQGIGKMLFQEMEAWARKIGIHRLELTVMSHNERAVALYRKMGFEIEGTKRHSYCVNGRYVDDYYMGKLLPLPHSKD